MGIDAFFNSPVFTWIVLPLLIFLGRVIDVTLGTIRIMFVARGNKLFAPILGFFEVFIWLLAMGQIMKNLDNIFCYIAYAGGFAMGTFIGIRMEERLALGKLVIRVITTQPAESLIASLRRKGFGVTKVDGMGKKGPVNLIFTVIKRKKLHQVISLIEYYNPRAFYSVEDTRYVASGIFRSNEKWDRSPWARPLRILRKRRVYRRLRTIRKGK